MYESPTQTVPTIDAKGIETIRRDTCPLVAKTMEKCLRLMFATKDLSLVRNHLEQVWTDVLGQRLSLQDFVFAKEVRLGSYSQNKSTWPPAAILAQEAMEVDPRAEPLYGERIPYVVVEGRPGARLVDMVVSPHTVLRNPHRFRMNALYYITKQINPAMKRLLHLVGADIDSWFAALARPRVRPQPAVDTSKRSLNDITVASRATGAALGQRLVMPLSQTSGCVAGMSAGGKRKALFIRKNPSLQRIDRFYARQHCVICDSLSEALVCVDCASRPQEVALVLQTRLKQRERRMRMLTDVCLACTGGGSGCRLADSETQQATPSHVHAASSATEPTSAASRPYTVLLPRADSVACVCDSLDCPVLFSKYETSDVLRLLEQQLHEGLRCSNLF